MTQCRVVASSVVAEVEPAKIPLQGCICWLTAPEAMRSLLGAAYSEIICRSRMAGKPSLAAAACRILHST